jgi:fumarate reductase flavoprotein subunit
VAHPHGILVTWALMMEGGIQVNLEGRRFSNEHLGYSEQAVAVLAQPEQTAFNIFDRPPAAAWPEIRGFPQR